MPIYEYTCDQCGKTFEKLIRRIAEAAKNTPSCPSCGCAETRRVMSAFARHGEPGVDREAIQAERAEAERKASITPKEQIDKWRSYRNKKT
jgi:putative FmdB family regulatory protein